MLRRFSKRGGRALGEMRFDLRSIEIGPVSASASLHLLTKPAVVRLAVAHDFERKYPFVGRACQQDPHGSDTVRPCSPEPRVAIFFTSASMRVWEGGYQATVIFPDGVSLSSEETYPTIAEALAAAAIKLLDMSERLATFDRTGA